MNQIKKRLTIIDLAISITDNETIELQVLKLKLIKIDLRVEDIIALLQSEDYTKAQSLISEYIQLDEDKIIPQAKPNQKPTLTDEDQAIIDEFQLFVSPTKRIRASSKKQEEIKEIKEDETPKIINIDIDNLLKIEPTPKAEIETKIESKIEPMIETVREPTKKKTYEYKKVEDIDDGFFNIEEDTRAIIEKSIIPKDTFFDTLEKVQETPIIEEEEVITPENKPPIKIDNIEEEIKEETIKEIIEETKEELKNTDKLTYEAIPHIEDKLLSMRKQYLSTDKSYENFSTVEILLTKISQEGYTEKEIEETLFSIKKFVDDQRYSEAAQLLLVCAATESKFAHLMLARELYKGTIVNRNISEAFLIINNLATGNNAEALCDLGQFYENGIGVTKDKKKAETLYKDSMELGITRAKTHYKRVKKENRSFFRRG
ncbi:MAG: tetratricopeptide repeat protein [Sulfurovum sp.]